VKIHKKRKSKKKDRKDRKSNIFYLFFDVEVLQKKWIIVMIGMNKNIQ